jgi:hypothetical protein
MTITIIIREDLVYEIKSARRLIIAKRRYKAVFPFLKTRR